MNSVFDPLKDRVMAMASTIESLRAENQVLRKSLLDSQKQVTDLKERIDEASRRIESILKSRTDGSA